jgi:hypothetical protein
VTLAPMYFGFVTIQRIICLVQGRPPSAGIGIRPLAIHTELALLVKIGRSQDNSRHSAWEKEQVESLVIRRMRRMPRGVKSNWRGWLLF